MREIESASVVIAEKGFTSLIRQFCLLTFVTALMAAAVLFFATPTIAQNGDDTEDAEEAIDFTTLENPVPNTAKSIARGKMVYTRYCTECHGPDGKAEVDLIADATNLTEPKLWRNGTTEGEIFKAIKHGAGVAMPPYSIQIRNDDDMWHMVNFIQSLWPEDLRPEIEEEPSESTTEE